MRIKILKKTNNVQGNEEQPDAGPGARWADALSASDSDGSEADPPAGTERGGGRPGAAASAPARRSRSPCSGGAGCAKNG